MIGIAAIMGNEKQREKAKEWVAKLGDIFDYNKTEDSQKIKLIIEHLEEVEKHSEFNDLRKCTSRYCFRDSGYERVQRLSKTFGKPDIVLIIVESILGILSAIQILLKL
jgi:hypothetical protein